MSSRGSVTDSRLGRTWWFFRQPPDGAWRWMIIFEPSLTVGSASFVPGLNADLSERAAAALVGLGIGLLVYLAVRAVWGWFWAPSWQRDDARDQIKSRTSPLDIRVPPTPIGSTPHGAAGFEERFQWVTMTLEVTNRSKKHKVSLRFHYDVPQGWLTTAPSTPPAGFRHPELLRSSAEHLTGPLNLDAETGKEVVLGFMVILMTDDATAGQPGHDQLAGKLLVTDTVTDQSVCFKPAEGYPPS